VAPKVIGNLLCFAPTPVSSFPSTAAMSIRRKRAAA